MAYLQLGVVDTSHFNSTKYPGVCNPSDSDTLAIFKNLQAQLNRVAQGLGLTKITVDGSIGPGTVALLAQIAANITSGGVSADPARNILAQTSGYTCVDVASNADMLGSAAQGMADQMSVPTQVQQPSATSTLVSSAGVVSKIRTPTPAATASLTDMLAGVDQTTLLALAAGAGAIIYFTGKPKRGARSTKSSRRASRRRSNYRYR